MKKPTKQTKYWYIEMDLDGNMSARSSMGDADDAWESGNCFRTKKACKLAIEEISKTMIRISRES